MKFDPTGKLLWRIVYETAFDGSSTKKCLIDAQNNIYVLGLGNNGTGIVTKVKKISPAGTPLWSYFDNAGIGAPINFKFTPDNNILITSRGITGSINGYTKINLNGVKIWSYAGVNSLTVGDAAGDTYGNSYLINGQYGVTTTGSILKKLSSSGTVIWEKTLVIAGMRVEVGTDNNPVVSGFPNSGSAGAAFMKFDSNGNLIWQNLDADGAGFALLAHGQMKLDGSNAAYLAASTMSQMAVCKVNSDGTSAWTASTSSGYPTCIDFGTDNSVFVVGGTTARFLQTSSAPVPAVPTNLAAIAAGTSAINLSWKDNATNETGFLLQRSLSGASGFTTIATLAANTTTYANSGLSSSTTYYYRIQAVNAAGNSAWSNVTSATTATITVTPPAAPSNLTAVATGCNSILLKWVDKSANETGFEVRRSLSSYGTYTTIATVGANSSTYTNTGLTNGRRYYYMVRAVNSAGKSSYSNKVSAIAVCTTQKSATILPAVNAKSEEVLQVVKLFPNPVTTGEFNLNLPDGTIFPASLQMFSMTGQKVMQIELNDCNNTISTDGLINGLYIISVEYNGKAEKLKLQINRK
jgi:fibronectin type 3 domain-containing protein